MKLKKSYLLLVLFALFAVISCEKMEDMHYKYIENGEIRYSTKLDSVETFAGNGRVLITGILQNPFSVNKIGIYYNEYNDSLSFPVTTEADTTFLSLLIENLEEKSYSFYIYTEDNEGNRSVKVTAFSSSYGERYQQGLLTRALNNISIQGDTLTINWLPADEKERGTEFIYTDTLGQEVALSVDPDSSSTILTDFSQGFDYRTLYVPEQTALDTFPSDWAEKKISVWHSAGTINDPFDGPRDLNQNKVLEKKTDNIYEAVYADYSSDGYRMRLEINEDNTVNIIALGSTPVTELNGENSFDPVNNIFTLNYKFEGLIEDMYIEISETLVLR